MYSQNDEEKHILHELDGIGPAKFLDIGAHDGMSFSNTFALIQRGWSGVMVEPALEAFQGLLRNHGSNPRLTLIHAAIGRTRGLTPFWNNPSFYSTTETANLEKWKPHLYFSPLLFVGVITFEDLEPWLSGVELVSIDTEGTSADLLFVFPIHKHRPKVICVEHDGRLQQCNAWAKNNGYRYVTSNPENLIVVREDS